MKKFLSIFYIFLAIELFYTLPVYLNVEATNTNLNSIKTEFQTEKDLSEYCVKNKLAYYKIGDNNSKKIYFIVDNNNKQIEVKVSKTTNNTIYNELYISSNKAEPFLSNNLTLYIETKDTLKLTLSTNQISFEDFSGVQDSIKEKSLTLIVSSTLPYEINSFLLNPIESTISGKTINYKILNLKASTNDKYKTFNKLNTRLNLLDYQPAGFDKVHDIDFKLNSNIEFVKDKYKVIMRFEANQK